MDDVSDISIREVERNNGQYVVNADDIDQVNITAAWVASRGGGDNDIKTIEMSLEEIFLELMDTL